MGGAAVGVCGKKNEKDETHPRPLSRGELRGQDIEGLLAEGLLMGLRRSDWLALTPKQYALFREAWIKNKEGESEREGERVKGDWERSRWMVFRAMCPPSGKTIRIKDLIEFPWEKLRGGEKEKGREGEVASSQAPRNDNKERFDDLVKRWDDNNGK